MKRTLNLHTQIIGILSVTTNSKLKMNEKMLMPHAGAIAHNMSKTIKFMFGKNPQ